MSGELSHTREISASPSPCAVDRRGCAPARLAKHAPLAKRATDELQDGPYPHPISRSKKASVWASETSLATKHSPMPLARMNVSRPRSTFLSWRIAARIACASVSRPGICGDAGRQADRLEVVLHAHRVLPRAQAEFARKAERAGHADRHALAMDEARAVVARQPLERVAEGVAEIEQRAFALLGLVGGDDARLGGAAPGDRLQTRRAAGEHFAPVRLQPVEEIAIADQAVFDDLGVAGAKLARAQRVERRRCRRARETADETRRSGSCPRAN